MQFYSDFITAYRRYLRESLISFLLRESVLAQNCIATIMMSMYPTLSVSLCMVALVLSGSVVIRSDWRLELLSSLAIHT